MHQKGEAVSSAYEQWMFVGPGLDGPLAVKPIVTDALGAREGD
jgi:hypothetical protein